MTIHTINLVQVNTYGVDRFVLEEGVYLQGNFKHNGTSRMSISVMLTEADLDKWSSRGQHFAEGERGAFCAQATVIALHPMGPRPTTIAVAVGDILETNVGRFEIKDDLWLRNPRLVAA